MSVDLVDSGFSADCFALWENNQPVCTDKFLHGLQVLATQATSAINNPKAVEQAFERIQNAKWENISTETKKIVDQRIQEVSQKWVKVSFGSQFRHVPREHLKQNCGPKFQAQYSSVMKDATEPKLDLLPPNGVLADDYDQTNIKAFLDYFQTGTLSENALNGSILDLLSLAHQHQIEGLITKCTEFLKEQFDDHENLDTAWEVAIEQNIPQLTFACLSYMQANQDKISKDLTRKYEKALPGVKALFADEILLNHSPSGNIEVRVEIYNEETTSHIEQLSKLFSIRSLVISEKSPDKLLNNSEKLFPFLNKISPELKDVQELIIWNETPEDNDFLTLNDLFPKLTAYGNVAPFLITFDEVKTYLNKFKNPDADDQESEKLVLRSLNLSSISTLDDVQMAEITSYLKELYLVDIKSNKITLVAFPKATLIYCQDCISLTTIEAPKATVIYCPCCKDLTTIKAPEATGIYCQFCRALTTIDAPKVTRMYCSGCRPLSTLDAPKAIEIFCDGCTALTTLDAPKATEIFCDGCTALTTIDAPKATKIHCRGCTALKTLDAPKATVIYCQNCEVLTILKAPKAIEIDCLTCIALTTIEATEAKHIICNDCKSLISIKAPKATEIYCRSCTALTTLVAPKATVIYCRGSTSLTTLQAPNATVIDCQNCTSLTTLETPNVTVIDCNNCTSLTTLETPNVTVIDCNNCTSLTTLQAPNATVIDCYYCRALTTLAAPEATEIDRRGCKALTTIDAPKATVINCKGCPKLKTTDDRFKCI